MKHPNVGENEVVMLCKHLWEGARCRVRVPWDSLGGVSSHKLDPPATFKREDGTEFKAHWAFACKSCSEIEPGEVDFIETRFLGDRFSVSDFLRRGTVQ